MIGKVTKTAVERLGQGQLLWDQVVIGFGARRQRRMFSTCSVTD